MKMNDIKYSPKSNAFSDVYTKATGIPFVGEMMVAAAGNGESDNGGNDEEAILFNVVVNDMGGNVYTVTADSDPTAYEQNWNITLAIHYDKDGVDTVGFTANLLPDEENTNKFVGYDNDDIDSDFNTYKQNGGTFVDKSVGGDDVDFDGEIVGTWTYHNV